MHVSLLFHFTCISCSKERKNLMLKRKFMKILITLAVLLMPSTLTPVYAGDVQTGYFDDFDGNTIVGWGWNPSKPDTAIPVHVSITSKDTGEPVGDFHPTAAIHREDLSAEGIGNGAHGFRIQMNWDALPDGIYLVEGWAEGTAFGNTKTYAKGEAAKAEAEKDSAASAEPAVPAAGSAVSLGLYRTTGYCPCRRCSSGWGGQTSTGAIARSSHTVAVDPRVIPYGSRLMIDGVIYTAEDCGSGVNGKHIDIYYDTHTQASRHGLQTKEVFLIQ